MLRMKKVKIMVFNKIDLVEDPSSVLPVAGEDNIYISAKYGRNIDELVDLIKSKIFKDLVRAKLLVPYSRGDISSYICEKAGVFEMEYKDSGTWFDVELKSADYQRLKEYEII